MQTYWAVLPIFRIFTLENIEKKIGCEFKKYFARWIHIKFILRSVWFIFNKYRQNEMYEYFSHLSHKIIEKKIGKGLISNSFQMFALDF